MFASVIRNLARFANAMALAVLVGVLPVAQAQPAHPPRHGAPGGEPPEPPPEALTACEGKAEGDQVEITLPDGQVVQAECALFGDRLAARPPQRGPAPPRPAS